MRRFCFLLIMVFLFVPCAYSDTYLEVNPIDPTVTAHYSVFVNGDTATLGKGGSLFDFNSLCIDLYLTDTEDEAYLIIACCKDHIMRSSGLFKVSVINDDGHVYFSSISSGLYLIGEWDENGTDLWLDYSGRSFRLTPAHDFSVYSDWK